ncbi:ATP-binding protein [[Acholeplasma] multilocale]|uniref:ATP-binding protein n=1 Tax=[Acholeplasma] multilocale TaxID=264638 RepID=UPI0006873D84|nr:ATP-binding protein [[Acholeplasma] multilocale]
MDYTISLNKFKDNKVINKLIAEFEITDSILLNSGPVLEDFVTKYIECGPGPLSSCKQETRGYEKSLRFENDRFYVSLKKCAHWLTENKNFEIKSHFIYTDYDVDGFDFTAGDYLKDIENNADIFTEEEIKQRKTFLIDALTRLQEGYGKGLYLFGEPGVGKTTLIKVLANHAAFKKHKVAFSNVGDLINSVKDSWNDPKKMKQNSIVKNLKHADVLFLDDIGGEIVSNWTRDDFLFTILNYRMEHKKITFFTSNFSMEELADNYSVKNDNSNIEKIKRKRFIERIKGLSVAFELKGNNHRK